MTWDVPVKDDCPVCGHTMFKKAGRGFKKPFCINPECSNFLPEDQRGYPKKPAAEGKSEEPEAGTEEAKPAAKKSTAKKAHRKRLPPRNRLPRKPRPKQQPRRLLPKRPRQKSLRRVRQRPRPRSRTLKRRRAERQVSIRAGSAGWNPTHRGSAYGSNSDWSRPGGQRVCLAIGPAWNRRHPPGDEAGEKDPGSHNGSVCGSCGCSNSLRSDQLENAVGLLKEELRRMGSLILSCADATRVEAGGALAVDRHGFAALVTERIRNHPGSGLSR